MQKATMTSLRLFSLLAVSLLLALSSCKKDKSGGDGPDNSGGANKLKEYKQGEEFVRFTYNTDGTVQKARVKTDINTGGEEVDYTFTYNGQKKIAEITTSRIGERIVPVYENGQMVRVDYFDGPDRLLYTAYTYEAGKLKKATIFFNQETEFEPFTEFVFTYVNDNLTRSDVFMATGVPNQLSFAGHVTYQHDAKTNPLFDLKDFFAILWQAPSRNNVTREEHFDQDNQLEDVYSYAYTYKSNGKPEKAVLTQGLPGETPVTTNIDYTYQ